MRTWYCRLVLNALAAVRSAEGAARATGLAVLLALAAFDSASAQTAEGWKIQFFYDKSDSSLNIVDLECASAQRCVAAGIVADRNDRQKGVLVSTRDGGLHWTLADMKENPASLFFLNDSRGWMVTEHGIWATGDGGETWKKAADLKGIVRVYFFDPSHGYAIGLPKAVYETTDGGKKWTKLPAAGEPASDPKHTIYQCISFLGQHGVIVGAVEQDQSEQFPATRASALRPQRNSTTVTLETLDGGKTWQSRANTTFGTITTAKLTREGLGAILVEYHDEYTLPSSVFTWRFGADKPETIFAERNRAVTDFAFLPDGKAVLAAIEPPGNSNQIPIPGKLKMLQSSDLKAWQEMDVDYRAVARRAVLAAPDAHHTWVATDTGMILGLGGNASSRNGQR